MFKVGDMVYVAFAVGWKFETHLTTVKDVVEKDGEVKYIVECYCDAARFSNDMFEHYDDSRKENEIFEATKEGKAKCDKYVSDYYYDGLCRGCEYEDFGSVFRCADCSHCKDMGRKNPTHSHTRNPVFVCLKFESMLYHFLFRFIHRTSLTRRAKASLIFMYTCITITHVYLLFNIKTLHLQLILPFPRNVSNSSTTS